MQGAEPGGRDAPCAARPGVLGSRPVDELYSSGVQLVRPRSGPAATAALRWRLDSAPTSTARARCARCTPPQRCPHSPNPSSGPVDPAARPRSRSCGRGRGRRRSHLLCNAGPIRFEPPDLSVLTSTLDNRGAEWDPRSMIDPRSTTDPSTEFDLPKVTEHAAVTESSRDVAGSTVTKSFAGAGLREGSAPAGIRAEFAYPTDLFDRSLASPRLSRVGAAHFAPVESAARIRERRANEWITLRVFASGEAASPAPPRRARSRLHARARRGEEAPPSRARTTEPPPV
ncbi:hypothetical protein DFR70_10268 [Nocardia tenerifensis]|uniref:Uncharacterized protein n=1 Tax=Nocardia tenerifensis TaxID=228006 RepID=A0A318K4X3_9NOCA|nr:hypothetical protein DFR70_10268 [Nocardia tenerifensis]